VPRYLTDNVFTKPVRKNGGIMESEKLLLSSEWVRRKALGGIVAVVVLICGDAQSAEINGRLEAILELQQNREDVLLDGFQWFWTIEIGVSSTLDEGLLGRLASHRPVDRYERRWRSSGETFLYESIAQQPARAIRGDESSRIRLETAGSKIYLWTKNSRLHFTPDHGSGLSHRVLGDVQSRSYGFSEQHSPSSLPVHSGVFGLGRSRSIAQFVTGDDSRANLTRGSSDAGFDCEILQIESTVGKQSYYFDKDHHLLVQAERWRNDELETKMVVSQTQTLQRGGETLLLPERYRYCQRDAIRNEWKVISFTSQKLKWQAAPLDQMRVRIGKGCRLGMLRTGRSEPVDFVEELTAENLDEVVSRIYSNHAERLKYGGNFTASSPNSLWGSLRTVLVISSLLAVGMIALFCYRRSGKLNRS
jgi:hypothetical protein